MDAFAYEMGNVVILADGLLSFGPRLPESTGGIVQRLHYLLHAVGALDEFLQPLEAAT